MTMAKFLVYFEYHSHAELAGDRYGFNSREAAMEKFNEMKAQIRAQFVGDDEDLGADFEVIDEADFYGIRHCTSGDYAKVIITDD